MVARLSCPTRPRRPARIRHRGRTPIRATFTAVLLAVVVAGCGTIAQEDRVDPRTELLARPSMEQTLARYEEMMTRLTEQLSTELGPFTWYRTDNSGHSGCGRGFPSDLNGENRSPSTWKFDGNLPDADWPRAVEIINAVTAEYGFIPIPPVVDRPGNHTVGGIDPALGAHYDFGTVLNTVASVTTGCHLPEAAPRPPA